MKSTILLIDDDLKLGELLESYLAGFEMQLIHKAHPEDGLRHLRSVPVDLVILDVMLPGKNGFQVCKEIRTFSSVPVLMLTARGDVTDRIVGLEIGADDYLPKPFEPRELVARVQTILKRVQGKLGPVGSVKVADELVLDQQRKLVTFKGESLHLTTTEYALIELFFSKPGAVITRDEVMDKLRGLDWEAFDRSIDIAISRLRGKLGDSAKSPRYLKTVWGEGYLFIPPVREDARAK